MLNVPLTFPSDALVGRNSMFIAKTPQHLPQQARNTDTHRLPGTVGVAQTPTYHLPDTYLQFSFLISHFSFLGGRS
jgi:hypothetical protein